MSITADKNVLLVLVYYLKKENVTNIISIFIKWKKSKKNKIK